MTRALLSGCLVAALTWWLTLAPVRAGEEGGGARPASQVVEAGGAGVRLRAKGSTLAAVAAEVRKTSGIDLQIPQALAADPLTADVAGPDWPAALAELLRDYSTLERWRGPGDLAAVRVLGRRGSRESGGPLPAASAPAPAPELGAPPAGAPPPVWPPAEGLAPPPGVWPGPDAPPPTEVWPPPGAPAPATEVWPPAGMAPPQPTDPIPMMR
jgi:hypothetical protein